MTTVFRLIGACLAYVLAASLGATIVAAGAAIVEGIAQHQYAKAALVIPGSLAIWILMIAITWLYSLPAAILVGVPSHFVLRFLRLDVLAAYIAVGAATGLWIGLYKEPLFPPYQATTLYVLMAVGAGAAAGGAFHTVMRPR